MRFLARPAVVEVGQEKEARVALALELNPLETELELLGLERADFPVTVYPRPVGKVLDGNHDLYFCGPYRWRQARQKVRAPTGLAYLVVSGKRKYWISRRPFRLVGTRTAVDLLPATRLTVHWFTAPTVRGLQVLDLSTSLGRLHVLLRPRLVRASGADRRAVAGTVVVPQGRVRLECSPVDAGALHWKRSIDLEGPLRTLNIEN